MTGHLGVRVSDLLDGRLSAAETDQAWTHVHGCHLCRDAVEREGWVKTQLVGLSLAPAVGAPDRLKGSILDRPAPVGSAPVGSATVGHPYQPEPTRRPVLVAVGGGALGAAVLGILALGVAPANAPSIERRAPVTNLGGPSSGIGTVFGPAVPRRAQSGRPHEAGLAPRPVPANLTALLGH